MQIYSPANGKTRRANPEWFTGTVWQDPIIDAPDPARVKAVRVSFEPGARTAWHTHPLGQTLHVLAGVGRVQTWDGPVHEIRAGQRRPEHAAFVPADGYATRCAPQARN